MRHPVLLMSVGWLLLLGLLFAQAQTGDLDSVIAQATAPRADWPFYYEVAGQDIVDDAGMVYLTLRDAATGEQFEGIVDVMPVVRRADGWEARLPGDPAHGALWNTLPPGVLRRYNTTPYKPPADPRLGPEQPYRFPWLDGQWATVTRSYRAHGPGQIDFDLGGLDVSAAKDGTIIYAHDGSSRNAFDSGAWWYWNVVIIEHGPHEYSLYGHLLPGSVPQMIRAQCSNDLSQPNCAVPIKAGEIIGQEGNTGFSNNPHLHVEFGQAYGIVPYPDGQGGVVYAGHVYKEQNVAFEGYSATDVGRWGLGDLHQASHGAQAPMGENLVRNGDFGRGTDEWTASGQINWQVREGVMRVTRLRTSDPPDWARFYQDLNYGIAANRLLEVVLLLGNDSGIRKTVSVSLFNSAGRHYGEISCAFALEPGRALQPYIVRGVTNRTWANVRLEFSVNPPDGAPAALVDEVVARRVSGIPFRDVTCGDG